MREHKFRGMTEKGKWVQGDLVVNKSTKTYRIVNNFALVCDPVDYKGVELVGCSGVFTIVLPETVGEFTGLVDKNGKEIFEGDILCDCEVAHSANYEVRFEPAFFAGYDTDKSRKMFLHAFRFEKYEVIGTIHDEEGKKHDALCQCSTCINQSDKLI